MKAEQRIFKNTLSLSIGKILSDLATFLFLIYFARVFGISSFGQYAFAMSLGGFLSILVGLGLNTLVIREISKDKSQDSKYMGNMLVTQSTLAIISWGLIALIVLLSNFDDNTKLIILIIGTYQILYKLTQLINSQFKAHEDMEYSAFLEIYHKVIILLFGSLTIVLWKDPVITLLIYPISALSMFMIGIKISIRKYGLPDFKINFPFIKELLYKAFPFLILIILVQFYDRLGVILLTTIQGDEATGIYAATDRFIGTIATGLGMFGAALFPIMSRFANEAPQKLIVTYERSVRIILVTVLPAATFLYLLSDQIILLLYGEAYIKSADVLAIMSWSILPSGLTVILMNILVATDQQKEIVRIELKIILGFIIACLALIPQFSFIGLAYAKLATSVALCIAFSWYLSKTLHYSPVVKNIKAPLIACAASIIIFKLMIDLGLWVTLLSASLTCGITLLLTGAIKHHDLTYARNILLGKDDKKSNQEKLE